MDRFATLAAFVKVAELRGFAPAARRLGLSPSAVTRLVAALEEHLGVRLLQRTTRLVTPTDEGERYLLQARRILAELDEADASLQATRAEPSGRFTVSAPLVFGRLHVGPLFSAYLSRYPAVHGELILSDRMINLIDEGVDAAVRIGHLADSSLRSRRIGETRRVVVASPDYLARSGAPGDPADIRTHRCIHFSGFAPGSDWEFEQNGAKARVTIDASFVTNSADTAIQHAISSGGLTMVLAYQAANAICSGALRIVLAEYERPPLPIQIVYPTSRLLSAKVRAFIDMAVTDTDWSFTTLG
ncbi:transcriptional regulator, LysR family [Bosea sp. OK403]|uniref:LysR family transcriptional regulator n=1 Tax=Bosea sp. OK403 TaxID=1855286 RepID=UPI0008EF6F0F|nr:LysR family transcriptional regulator [Bosea sp. OK403]SFI03626.1 transcriptional regulator, LysR family [Bosea sp. OK403]